MPLLIQFLILFIDPNVQFLPIFLTELPKDRLLVQVYRVLCLQLQFLFVEQVWRLLDHCFDHRHHLLEVCIATLLELSIFFTLLLPLLAPQCLPFFSDS